MRIIAISGLKLETEADRESVYALWRCPSCENTAVWTYRDLATRGDPVCAICDADMVLEE